MTALRGAAMRTVHIRRSLSDLDLAALGSLERLRLLTTEYFQRLHVADGSPQTRRRRTRALLRRLVDRGLLVHLPREVGGPHFGSQTALYCLSQLGHAVVAAPNKPSRRRMVWRTKPYFQDHMLAVSRLYVELVEACRHGEPQLLGFEAESACSRLFVGSGGRPVTLKPDAKVRVGRGAYELTSFVEVDLDSESVPTIERKCRVYLSYWRSGLEQQHRGVFPRVVWLVPDQRRADKIKAVAEKLAYPPNLFTVALLSDGSSVLMSPPADWRAGEETA